MVGRELGERVAVGAMIFSNSGPVRWKPPITAWMRSSPVSFRT